jgi:hypothetical protein
MCLAFSDAEKKQPAKGLPPTWTFLFRENRPYRGQAYVPGLHIYDSTAKLSFRSVEAAIANFPKKVLQFNKNAAQDFYRHIGIKPVSPNVPTAISAAATGPSLKAKASVKAKKKSESSLKPAASPSSLEELLEASCGDCLNCSKEDCGKCSSCISNRTSFPKEVCLQKVRL